MTRAQAKQLKVQEELDRAAEQQDGAQPIPETAMGSTDDYNEMTEYEANDSARNCDTVPGPEGRGEADESKSAPEQNVELLLMGGENPPAEQSPAAQEETSTNIEAESTEQDTNYLDALQQADEINVPTPNLPENEADRDALVKKQGDRKSLSRLLETGPPEENMVMVALVK